MSEPNRIGIGYDIHRLVEGRKLVLGGVEIPFEKGLLGHSDSDVLAHAICDALLGAAALGDIGTHFPDSDPRWSGASSLEFLAHVVELVVNKGYRVANVDATVIAERPKLAPHIQAIRETLASVLRIDVDQVNVKAKTNEGLESVGCGEAMAAQAILLLACSGATAL
jgi:2-C-methyl-D-erythritol 2,4-cyclodiphosphate synthase